MYEPVLLATRCGIKGSHCAHVRIRHHACVPTSSRVAGAVGLLCSGTPGSLPDLGAEEFERGITVEVRTRCRRGASMQIAPST
mmetsp:Transcript_13675/g.41267  ORF Transcript_13675/g.41267 Transcript_13675/m.41267 type:complete len:83 (-) Transcript_13675:55-303(-)